MKKHTIIITIFVLLAAVMQAAADSVWMPMDDYFMDAWKPESDNTCDHLERPFYLAAGEKGYVTAVKTPLDLTPLKTYPNGTEFKITFVCGKGDSLWGAVEAVRMNGETTFREDWKGESGYIFFSDLVRSYDSEAFKEDHMKELVSSGGDDFDICAGNEFVLWQAPNSGVQLEYVYEGYLTYICMDYDESIPPEHRMFHFGAFYRDPDGKRWAELSLRRDWETGWVCLDDLTGGGVKE
jgi:hypothetical protein